MPPFPKSLYVTSADKRSKPAIIGGPKIQIRPKLPFVGPIEGWKFLYVYLVISRCTKIMVIEN